ncbi:MAG: radical SAM protein [Rhodospirillales bacterium]|jgi:organic radical activating enzyme|nr:radical SAM protein [Rhodospirillales bacterium]MDP6644257.1 radical SAM protein [Rhodospirillales bacterium]MDP6843813.1 radical SAM protein [Rhodospirillales bacterium]
MQAGIKSQPHIGVICMIIDRLDNITKIPEEYRSATPPAPKSVKIELTAHCDFQCFYCATAWKLRDKGEIDWDFYCRIVKEMSEAGVEELGVFYLGESFLSKQLPAAIEFAKKEAGFEYLFLTTNGRMADADRLRACMEAGLDSLKFSFNYADAEQCKDMTRVDAFDTVVGHIADARRVRDEVEAASGHRCGLWASSIRYDGEQQERMEQAIELIEPHVDLHYWLPLYGQAGLTAGVRGTMPVAGNVGRADNMVDPLPCWALFTEGHVTYDGKLAACCFDHDGRFDMGDLNKMGFMEAWHSEPFQVLRQANLDCDVKGTACEKCIAYATHEIDGPRLDASPAFAGAK